jgi:DNA-binding NarL/FixJ family response regulator
MAIVDDHGVTRSGVRMMADALDGVEVVAEGATGTEALRICSEFVPDLVLMDLQMPEMTGIEATMRIKQSHPDVSILVLTVHEDEDAVAEAIHAGASGYLSKSCALDEFEHAVHAIRSGGTYMTPSIAGLAIQSLLRKVQRAKESADVASVVTDREQEVLEYLSKGLSARSISLRMGISERTVNTHIGHLYRKLGVNNRVDAVLAGMRLGLTEKPA